MIRPINRVPTGPTQHPFADIINETDILGYRNESVRSDKSLLRVSPTHESLRTDGLARSRLHERLIVHLELIVFESAPQIRFKLVASISQRHHFLSKKGESVASPRFCGVERKVSLFEEKFGNHPIVGSERYSNTGSDRDLMPP